MNETEPNQPEPSPRRALIAPRTIPGNRAFAWFGAASKLVRLAPGAWILTMLTWFVLILVAKVIPVVGLLFDALTSQIWLGGLFIGCAVASYGGMFHQKFLFEAFSSHLVPLALFSAMMTGIELTALHLIVGPEVWEIFLQTVSQQQQTSAAQEIPPEMFNQIVAARMWVIPINAVLMFVPVLVVLHNLSLSQAIKLSAKGFFANPAAMLRFFLVVAAFAILALLSFGLTLVILIPLYIAAIYFAHLDIFTAEESSNDGQWQA
ncbi:MAG: hypothetical protein HWE13_04865 [Gammaproteobacteria bacterium]|nr:hypothetical protein [Gammaproteobacteria bacterium]NVK87431.1 hypothetical protein [Gammaproteobacteria bacterium]